MMIRRFPTIRQFTIFACVLLALFAFLVVPKRSQVVIRLHDDQVEFQKLNNAIVEYIIREGYRYKVELVESTIKELHAHLLSGEIDVTLELWRENNLNWYSDAVNNGLITDLGKIYSGGKQYWIVSKWYAEKHNIESVFDMQEHWEDFVDPDDPSKGLFFNCIFGWTCLDINRVKLQAYGLDRYFNMVSPVSPDSLRAIYLNAQERSVPVFGYYWEPNSIMIDQSWQILREPPYSEEVWSKVLIAASGSGMEKLHEACAFKNTSVYKVVHRDLIKKAPDVYGMLKKIEIDREILDTILSKEKQLDPEGLNAPELAREFLLDFPEQWMSWVPLEVGIRLKNSLLDTADGS